MLTPFLKYVSEAKVIRRHSDLGRFSFSEVTERIYLSFLALALMSQNKETQSFAKSSTDQTMAKGTFDHVRMVNNDLANMLAIVSGDPEITKKLKNIPIKREAIIILINLIMKILLNLKRFLFFKKINKSNPLNQDEIVVEIRIIIKLISLK